jgi:hypothetical protein
MLCVRAYLMLLDLMIIIIFDAGYVQIMKTLIMLFPLAVCYFLSFTVDIEQIGSLERRDPDTD